jgi:hypothetical protein
MFWHKSALRQPMSWQLMENFSEGNAMALTGRSFAIDRRGVSGFSIGSGPIAFHRFFLYSETRNFDEPVRSLNESFYEFIKS